MAFLYAFLTLWMFGCHVEANLGEKRCMFYFLFCGLTANTFWLLYTKLFPPEYSVLGFGLEAVNFGMIYGYAYYRPDRSVLIKGVLAVPSRIYATFHGLVALLMVITPPYWGDPYVMTLVGGVAGAVYLDYLHYGPVTGYLKKLTHA